MNNYRFKFAELYQFFGGYFYQGWAADYHWERGDGPNFAAVVRHFKAVNPPITVSRLTNELEDLLALELEEEELAAALSELGNNYRSLAKQSNNCDWLGQILEILRESPTKSRVLRELQ